LNRSLRSVAANLNCRQVQRLRGASGETGPFALAGEMCLKVKASGLAKTHNLGFSLLELMLCIGLLALAILFIIGLFGRILAASTKGGDSTVAAYVATTEMDRLIYDPCRLQLLIQNKSYTPAPFEYTGIPGNNQSIALNHRTFYIQDTAQVAATCAPNCSIGCAPACNLYNIQVEVSWFGKSGQNKNGNGKTSLTLERLVFDENPCQ
jgi:type II secretory pathway pseudopilin PulG